MSKNLNDKADKLLKVLSTSKSLVEDLIIQIVEREKIIMTKESVLSELYEEIQNSCFHCREVIEELKDVSNDIS